MPYNICEPCIKLAQTAYAYKKKCEESDLKLRKFYTKVKIKEEHHYQHDDAQDVVDNDIAYEDDDHHQSTVESQDEYVDIKPEVTFNIDPLHGKKKKSSKKKIEKSYKKSPPKRSSRRRQSKKPSIIDYDSDNEDNDPTFSANVSIKDDPSYENYDDDDDDDDGIEEDDELEELELASKCKEIDGRYSCHMCDKTLADKRTLKLHIRLHTGKNLKECSTCGRGFSKKSHLDRHMLSHIKKEYKCEYCPEIFDNIQDRRNHIADHVGKYEYFLIFCKHFTNLTSCFFFL